MIEAYAVGVSLKLHDLVSPQLLKVMQEMVKLDALVLSLNKNIKAMSLDTTGMSALSRATSGLGRSMTTANAQAALLERHLKAIKTIGSIPALAPAVGGRGAGGGGGGYNSGIHGRAHISPHGIGVSSGMGLPSGPVLG